MLHRLNACFSISQFLHPVSVFPLYQSSKFVDVPCFCSISWANSSSLASIHTIMKEHILFNFLSSVACVSRKCMLMKRTFKLSQRICMLLYMHNVQDELLLTVAISAFLVPIYATYAHHYFGAYLTLHLWSLWSNYSYLLVSWVNSSVLASIHVNQIACLLLIFSISSSNLFFSSISVNQSCWYALLFRH